ncbi:MAG: hypothetical protein ACLQVN_07455 [Bryobacteraceae bacterium]
MRIKDGMTFSVLNESNLWPAMKIMSWLAPLEQDDPVAFRHVTSRITEGLTTAADHAQSKGDSDEAARCQQLASILQGVLRKPAPAPACAQVAARD